MNCPVDYKEESTCENVENTIYSCGIFHIFTSTFFFIVNWTVHQLRSEIPELHALKRLGQYIGPYPLHRIVIFFQVALYDYVYYKEVTIFNVFGTLGAVELDIFLKVWHSCFTV